jgi:hypothetical protein
MKKRKLALVGAVGVLALAGVVGLSQAINRQGHTVIVHLPDGQVERIHYWGDAPPEIVLAGEDGRLRYAPWHMALATGPFGLIPIADDLDRQMVALFAQADALAALPLMVSPQSDPLWQVDLGQVPPGSRSVSVVSTMSGGKVCTRSTEVTGRPDGEPLVVTRTSGDCGAAPEPSRPQPGPAPAKPGPQPIVA